MHIIIIEYTILRWSIDRVIPMLLNFSLAAFFSSQLVAARTSIVNIYGTRKLNKKKHTQTHTTTRARASIHRVRV